jgi:hypothetical protein
MLQLPQGKAARFSRAQIADITRGAKARVRVRRDPVLVLVAKADKVLDRYYVTTAAVFEAKYKLPKHDRYHAEVNIPDDLLNVEWSNGFGFKSEAHIDKQFKGATARARFRIRQSKGELRKLRPGHGAANLKLQLEQMIASDLRALGLFERCKQPLKAAFRRENRRLLKVQNKVGLVAARRVHHRTFAQLVQITKQISDTKPTTTEGALAILKYVENRLWCDRPGLFADFDRCPGNFGPLMRSALAVLTGGAAKGRRH